MIQEDSSEEIKKILGLLRQNLFLDAKDQIELLLKKDPNKFFLETVKNKFEKLGNLKESEIQSKIPEIQKATKETESLLKPYC